MSLPPDESLPPEDAVPGEQGIDGDQRIRRVAAVVGVLVFALIMLFALGRTSAISEPSSLLDRRVPKVAGPLLPTQAVYPTSSFDVDNHRGEWVLVNFFATWCAGCITEHPELVALESEEDFQLVSVVFDDSPLQVEDFFQRQGGTWPVISDASTAVSFQIAQIPESFLVAPSGVVVHHFVGGLRAADVLTVMGRG